MYELQRLRNDESTIARTTTRAGAAFIVPQTRLALPWGGDGWSCHRNCSANGNVNQKVAPSP